MTGRTLKLLLQDADTTSPTFNIRYQPPSVQFRAVAEFLLRCQLNPPLWGEEKSHQPVKGLCIAPRARISLYVTCLEPPWALLPLEPRVRPLVGHFGLAVHWNVW